MASDARSSDMGDSHDKLFRLYFLKKRYLGIFLPVVSTSLPMLHSYTHGQYCTMTRAIVVIQSLKTDARVLEFNLHITAVSSSQAVFTLVRVLTNKGFSALVSIVTLCEPAP